MIFFFFLKKQGVACEPPPNVATRYPRLHMGWFVGHPRGGAGIVHLWGGSRATHGPWGGSRAILDGAGTGTPMSFGGGESPQRRPTQHLGVARRPHYKRLLVQGTK